MSSVTQQIPNFIQGISDQPDELKNPGQLRKCVNGYPDLVSGLVKRNGIKWIGNLDVTQDGSWFHIEKESPELGQELYVGTISRTGRVSVWNAFTGAEMDVCYSNEPQFRKRHRTLENPATRINEDDLTCHVPGSSGGNEGYFVHEQDSEIQTITVNDYTFVTNRLIKPEMVRTKNNPEYYEAFIEVYNLQFGRSYVWAIYDLDEEQIGEDILFQTPTTSGGNTMSIDEVIEGWIEDLEAMDGLPDSMTWEKVGSGLYLNADVPFVVSSTEDDIVNVLSPSIDDLDQSIPADDRRYYSLVTNVSNLPRIAPQGYIVKVINSTADEDDYYLRYQAGGNQGSGSWEEIAAPQCYNEIDIDTMPHQIIRNRVVDENDNLVNIRFIVSPIDYEPRRAGDYNTNGNPSFLPQDEDTEKGRPINNVLFYRNRLVFLSDENIILSQAGDLFNWFNETNLGFTESDPIDLNCSTNSTAVLNAGIVTNSGLVLFSPGNQFLFTTDSDLLSAKTAKTNVLAAYDFNIKTHPFKMGANIGFFSDSGPNSILFQMSDTLREGEPTVVEQSEVISQSLPPGLDIISAAKEVGLVLAGKKDYDQVWIFKYFFDGQKLIQAAWFNWTLPGTLVYHWKTNDVYYTVQKDKVSGNLTLAKHSQTDRLEALPLPYYIYLDEWITVTPDDMTVSNGQTTFTLPYDPNPNLTMYAYSLANDEFKGRAATPASIDGRTVTLDGDWRFSNTEFANFAFGYTYGSSFEFPDNYQKTQSSTGTTKSDTNASLTIHRCKFNLGLESFCEFKLERFGKDTYVLPYVARPMDEYQANLPAIKQDVIVTVPIYEKNRNYKLQLNSDYPGPLFLFSMVWEGDMTNNFYRRV
jgi:hypothetical protein